MMLLFITERPRSVPESIVTKSWNDVQSNIGKFSQYFRQNFVVVDNNNATEDDLSKSSNRSRDC